MYASSKRCSVPESAKNSDYGRNQNRQRAEDAKNIEDWAIIEDDCLYQ